MKKKTVLAAIMLFTSIALLTGSVYLRRQPGSVFYNVVTAVNSADYMFSDSPGKTTLMLAEAARVLKIFFSGYVLSTLFFLSVSLLLCFKGLLLLPFNYGDLFSFFRSRKYEGIFLVFIFLFTLATVLLSEFFITGNYPSIIDEYNYLFQADLLKAGKLYAPSPPLPDFFQTLNTINDGKWYSKYTIGWPLLLAAASFVRAEFLAGPLCAALTVIFLYLTGKVLFNCRGGAAACLFALASPFFFMLGGTYLAHTSSGLFSIMFVFFTIKSVKEKGFFYPLLSGATSAFLMHIRPVDFLLTSIGVLPLIISFYLKSSDKESIIKKAVLALSVIILGATLLLVINKIQTGSPFLLAFQKYNPNELWGFGHLGHTPLNGIWNLFYVIIRNAFWTVPFLGVLSLFSAVGRYKQVAFLLFIPFLYALFYLGYYSLGTLEVGARFYYPAFLVLTLTAAGGLLTINDFFVKKYQAQDGIFIFVFIIYMLAWMTLGVYPVIIPQVSDQYSRVNRQTATVANLPGVKTPAVVFLKGDTGILGTVYTRNNWRYQDQQKLIVLYLTPEENKKLLKLFPERYIYTLEAPIGGGGFILNPGIDNNETSYNYLCAAFAYDIGVKKLAEAEKAYSEALRIKPDDSRILLYFSKFYMQKKEYNKALTLLKKLSKSPPAHDAALYLMAQIYNDTGRISEAKTKYAELLSCSDNAYYRKKAEMWLKNYNLLSR